MSYTNAQIVGDALRKLNVISEIDDPSAEQGTHGLRQLNRMMEQWTENDISIGYFKQTSTTATAPIPEWAETAVITNLAIVLAPTYGATVSPELAGDANAGYTTLLRKSLVEKRRPQNNDHLPMGEWLSKTWDITTDS